MSLDGLPPAHLRVLLDGLPVFERYGLLLAGAYAFRAHEIALGDRFMADYLLNLGELTYGEEEKIMIMPLPRLWS